MSTADLDAASVRLWTENWHLLAHRSELSAPQDFVRFDICGRQVLLFNDGASVIAFDNRCPHRGARIFDGDHGRERFLCRYHGWSYAKGRVFVADKQSLAHCALDQLALNTLQLAWVGDFVFVSEAAAHSVEDQLAGLEPLLESVSRGIERRWDFNRQLFEADWRIALENALEPYHLGPVHPETLNTLRLSAGENRYFGRNSVWSAPLGDERMAKRLRYLNRLFDLTHQFEGYESIYVFPFAMISSTYGFSQSIQTFLPSSMPERTHFTSRLFTGRLKLGTKPGLIEPLMASSAMMNRTVFEEDHDICKRVAVGTWSSDPPRFWSISEDKLIHFRSSYRDAVSDCATRSRLAGALNTD